jgi:hypothetical protein
MSFPVEEGFAVFTAKTQYIGQNRLEVVGYQHALGWDSHFVKITFFTDT